MNDQPFIVGLGGTTRPGSSSEKAMNLALQFAKGLGAEVRHFGGQDLQMPMYEPGSDNLNEAAQSLISALRLADGVIVSSPCYHGGISGLLKNAFDYVEEMRDDKRVYFDGRAVGVIGVGNGYQGPSMVIQQLRQVTHALRGWNVPLGVAVNSAVVKFAGDTCNDSNVVNQIHIMAKQVFNFAQLSSYGKLKAA